MQDHRRIFDYFLVVGLPSNPVELTPGAQECGYRENASHAPITDLCVIFPSLGEEVPEGFECVKTTPNGYQADLNHGSLRTNSCFLCYKRGFHKRPIVDIGVLYEGKGEVVMDHSSVIKLTPSGKSANVNNGKENIFITFRRAPDNAPNSMFSVSELCVILANKGESPPHTYYTINKNLNKAFVGSDVFLCYKKSLSNVNRLAYKPEMLDRFPPEDTAEYPLPTSVPIFCLPMGAVIECWPAKCNSPPQQFSTFVLTNLDGRKLYGASVAFYEDYERPLTAEQMEKLNLSNDSCAALVGSCSESGSSNEDPTEQMTFHVNKCICVVSRFPFFDAFRRYLYHLHDMCLATGGGSYSLPIERHVSFVMFEVPFPTFRRPRVTVQLGNKKICFDNPEDSPMPLSGANYLDFLRLLGAENCIYLMLIVLLEQKVLIHSLRPWYLTSVAEAVCNLLFPFRWQCPYIPQCPLDLAGVLHAPMPFVAGVDSSYFELYQDPPSDVTCVDLDTNTISSSEVRCKYKVSLLPHRATKALRRHLVRLSSEMGQLEIQMAKASKANNALSIDVDPQFRQRKKKLELEVQESFLRFMASILKDYQNYLRPIKCAPSIGSTDLRALFDVSGFLRSRDKGSQEFYKILINTQLFIRFIEERSFLTDKNTNAYLAFFDDCVQRLEGGADGSSVRLLDYESVEADEDHAAIFTLVEGDASPARPYVYEGKFPTLDQSRFGMETYGDVWRTHDPSKGLRLIELTPAAKRTKQETKSALESARRQARSPLGWAKCLLGYAYSVWFIHLPALMKVVPDKSKALNGAHCLLKRMESARFDSLDEVCYRTVIQMCGLYEQPVLAVKVFVSMNKHGVRPNAVTYGIYNRSILDSQWPAGAVGVQAQRHWRKLRNVILAVRRFRRALGHRPSSTSLVQAPSARSPLCGDAGRQTVKLVNGSAILPKDEISSSGQFVSDETQQNRNTSYADAGRSAEWPSLVIKSSGLALKRWSSDFNLFEASKESVPSLSGVENGDQKTTVCVESETGDDVRKEVDVHPLALLEESALNGPKDAVDSPALRSKKNLDKFDCAHSKLFVDDPEALDDLQPTGRLSSVRDFFSRINEVTTGASPVSRLVRLRRSDDLSSPDTAGSADNQCKGPEHGSGSERSFVMSPSFASRLSTSFADAQNKMLSKVTVLQRQSGGGLARLRTNVSSVINDIRHLKSFDQFSTVRGSWSSLSLGETSNSANRPSGDDKLSIKDDVHVQSEAIISKAELPNDDPAFRLSSPSLSRILNFNATNSASWTGRIELSDYVEVLLSTTSRCTSCDVLNYDDEVMAGWYADESQLNTRCAFCKNKFVPMLTVIMQPLKRSPNHSWYQRKSADSQLSQSGMEGTWRSLDNLVLLNQSSQEEALSLDDQLSQSNHLSGRLGRRGSRRCILEESTNRRMCKSADSRKDWVASIMDSLEITSSVDADQKRQSFTVPYLNFIVLRKELENVVVNEGDSALVESDMLERRPILFWNMTYVFHRLGAPTHFVSQIAKFYASNFSLVSSSADQLPRVMVRCVYEIPSLFHQDDCVKPIYFSFCANWNGSAERLDVRQGLSVEQCNVSRLISQKISSCLASQNLSRSLQLLINNHRRHGKRSSSPAISLPKHCSIFRDLLFTALLRFDNELDVHEFEGRYAKAFGQLSPKLASILPAHDHPPGKAIIACRRVFIPLDVI